MGIPIISREWGMAVAFKFGNSVCVGALFAATLAACGGGGGGDDTPQTPAPIVSTIGGNASGYYAVTESRSGSSAPSTVHVVNPADPTHPKLTVTVDGQGHEYYRRTTSGTVDNVTHTARFTGEPLLIYVKGGALYQVDLRAGGGATPVRISSESHACQIHELHHVSKSGYDVWVEASTAGVDGSCTNSSDNRTVLVRTYTSSAIDGKLLPTSSSVVNTFGTSATPLLGLLIREAASPSTKLRLYNANMTPGNYVTGSEGAQTIYQVYGSTAFVQPGRYYVVDKQLKQFTTDGTNASLSSSLYTFTTASIGTVEATTDTSATYFVDDTKVMRVSGASPATPLATLAASASTYWVWQSSTHLIFSQGSTISAVPKSGGTVTPLKTGSTVVAFNGSGSQVTYFLGTSSSNVGELRSINVDGTNDTLLEGGVVMAGIIANSTFASDGSTPVFKSVVYCIPRSGETDCRNGALKTRNIATHATTSLGTFHTTSALAYFYLDPLIGFDGFTLPITVTGVTPTTYVRQSDAYVLSPDAANPLARVTTLVP